MIREIRAIRVQKNIRMVKSVSIRVYPCAENINHQTKSNMKIRSYSKQELAMLYFPDSDPRIATNHLMRWINRCPPLLEALSKLHYRRSAKFFTTTQVTMIMEYLGEP